MEVCGKEQRANIDALPIKTTHQNKSIRYLWFKGPIESVNLFSILWAFGLRIERWKNSSLIGETKNNDNSVPLFFIEK